MKKKKPVLLIVFIIVAVIIAVPIITAFAGAALLMQAEASLGGLLTPLLDELEQDLNPAPTPTSPTSPPPPPRPFPDWFNRLPVLPDWIFDVDELPDWFYDLPAMPVWFYTIPRIPQWFYTITDIPDWFYGTGELPEGGINGGGQDGEDPDDPKSGEWAPGVVLPDDWEWPEGWEWLANVTVPQGVDPGEWLTVLGWPPDLEMPPGFAIPTDPPDEPDNGGETEEPPDEPGDITTEPDNGNNAALLDRYLYPFIYQLHDGNDEFGANIPMGMITDSEVRLGYTVPSIRLMRDGEEIWSSSGNVLINDGEYEAFLPSGEQVFGFRIIRRPVSSLTEYIAPPGFYIQSVGFEDAAGDLGFTTDEPVNSERFDLTQDGTYYFSIVSVEDDALLSIVSITRDTTPPRLSFEGWEGWEESVPGPVEFFSDEEDVLIAVTLDGEPHNLIGNTLTLPGSYVITATDLAGNETTYTFRLTQSPASTSSGINAAAVFTIILVVLLLGALVFFLIRNRTKARVR